MIPFLAPLGFSRSPCFIPALSTALTCSRVLFVATIFAWKVVIEGVNITQVH